MKFLTGIVICLIILYFVCWLVILVLWLGGKFRDRNDK